MDSLKKLYDKEFRQKFINNPNKYIKDLGHSNSPEIKIVKSTKYITYIAVISPDLLPDDVLDKISAAGLDNISTVGTAGTIGTVGTLPSTGSTVGSFGSLGSYGSVSDSNFK